LDVEFVCAGPAVSQEAGDDICRTKRRLESFIEVVGPIFGSAKDAFFGTVDIRKTGIDGYKFPFPATSRRSDRATLRP
jgi:hypothetical protein